MGDKINHPDHYQNIAGVEAIDILNDVVKDLPGKQAAMLWNSMKYLFRFQKKNGVEDLKKARTYLDYLIDDIEATQDAAKAILEKHPEFLCDTWRSHEYGYMAIFAKSKEPNGMPSKLVFYTEHAAEGFRNAFYNMLSKGYDEFSIVDVALEMKFTPFKNGWNNWDDVVNWKKVHDNFTIEPVGDKYELIFNYKDANSETLENDDPQKKAWVIYKSKISGHAEVHYSMHMYAGTCTSIVFTSELDRDMFIARFFNKLGKKTFSIRDVLSDANFVIPNDADTFNVRLPWKDLFSRFELLKEDDKYILEFVYKAIRRKK